MNDNNAQIQLRGDEISALKEIDSQLTDLDGSYKLEVERRQAILQELSQCDANINYLNGSRQSLREAKQRIFNLFARAHADANAARALAETQFQSTEETDAQQAETEQVC